MKSRAGFGYVHGARKDLLEQSGTGVVFRQFGYSEDHFGWCAFDEPYDPDAPAREALEAYYHRDNLAEAVAGNEAALTMGGLDARRVAWTRPEHEVIGHTSDGTPISTGVRRPKLAGFYVNGERVAELEGCEVTFSAPRWMARFPRPLPALRFEWTERVVDAMTAQHPYPWPPGEARRHVDQALDWLAVTLDGIVGAVNGWECEGDR